MKNEEISNYLESVISEIILYPSLGTLPYTILVFPAEDVPQKHEFQQNISHYVGFYFWHQFSTEDLQDFLTNSKEALGLDDRDRLFYIEKMMKKYKDPEAYEFWLSKQAAMAVGIFSGKVGDKLTIRISNPEELAIVEFENIIPKKQGLSLVSMIFVETN